MSTSLKQAPGYVPKSLGHLPDIGRIPPRGEGGVSRYLSICHYASPFISVYNWTYQFGAKVDNPLTLPTGTGYDSAFCEDGDYVVVAHAIYPFMSIYPWADGFGARCALDYYLPNTATGVDFICGTWPHEYFAVSHSNAPYISAWLWADGAGAQVTGYTPPANAANDLVWRLPQGQFVGVAHMGTPYVTIYTWIGSEFGGKIPDPITKPTGTGNTIAWAPNGSAVALAHNNSPFISVYPFSELYPWLGLKYASPSYGVPFSAQGVAFSPDGHYITVTHSGFLGTCMSTYQWSSATGFGAQISSPATYNNGRGVTFAQDGGHVVVTHYDTPYVTVYPWSNGFGAKLSDPVTLPTGYGNDATFGPLV